MSTSLAQAAHMHWLYWCLMLTVMAGGFGRIASWAAHKARLAGCCGR